MVLEVAVGPTLFWRVRSNLLAGGRERGGPAGRGAVSRTKGVSASTPVSQRAAGARRGV